MGFAIRWYCYLFICCWLLSIQPLQTSASLSTDSITSNNNTDMKGNITHRRDHKIHVLALEFEAVKEPLIFTIVVLLAGLSKIGFHHADFLSSKIPESCLLILLGTVFGAIVRYTEISAKLPELFNPHEFFILLLPPIILESAFSLYDRSFSDNLGTVLLFAVVGTVLACFLIGLSLYGLMLCGAMGSIRNMSLVQMLVFSALIVAVDPVAVLAVFTEIGVNDVLYFIVFGESLLNDGVTVVLYKVMQAFNLMDTIQADQIVLGIVKFFVVCFGGLLIGIIAGVVTALLTRLTVHVRVTQPLVIYTMAYLGFLLSELFEVSGIISIIGCGLVQRHYSFSNINHKSRTTVKYFTKVMASASEIVIFLFLGLELVSQGHEWHTLFVVWTLVLCTVFRFIITFAMASLVNRFDTMRVRRIGYDEMFMIAFGGLRGAVAFSLAALLSEEEIPMKNMFVTTTLAIVVFTVFFQGITIKPLVHILSITLAPAKNQSMYCELNNHVADHLMAGIEQVVGMRGKNHLREKLEQIDSDYMRKWLMNEPDPTDASLEDFYNDIVVKEHYRNLKLCGAANVREPANMPHISTSMYLNRLTTDEDSALAVQQPGEEGQEDHKTAEEEGPKLRHRIVPRKGSVDDFNALRSILKFSRNTRLNLFHNHDRNLTIDHSDNLKSQIIQKSAHNRRLQHLMSTTHPPVQRCLSWRDKDSQIALERGENSQKGNKRAVSIDLGSHSAAYRPLKSGHTTPSAPSSLELVSEEDDEYSNQLTGQDGDEECSPGALEMRSLERETNPNEAETYPYATGVEEHHRLISPIDPSSSSVQFEPDSEKIGHLKKGSQSSRHRLKRQDDIKTTGSDDVV